MKQKCKIKRVTSAEQKCKTKRVTSAKQNIACFLLTCAADIGH